MKLISACLFGCPCRFDGKHSRNEDVVKAFAGGAVLICPEQLGGLPTPRLPAELAGGDGRAVLVGTAQVRRIADGMDLTDSFRRGAAAAVDLARSLGATAAVLKSKSPSCGVTSHYEEGRLVEGPGVTAAALLDAGLAVQEVDRDE